MARVFSGIQPTAGGIPHLGNYLGALKGYAPLQDGNDCTYCVVDLHATTLSYDRLGLPQACRTTAAAMLACGVDPERSILYRQSAVPEHAVLSLYLSHMAATLGPLERMTQFKDKGRSTEGEQRDSVPLGLLTYPVLMAADIMLHRADVVPVGIDQHQHLQLAFELAKRFNRHIGLKGFFPAIQRVNPMGFGKVMSLRDPERKMSKSDPDQNGVIYLTDSLDQAAKKYRSAVSHAEAVPDTLEGLEAVPAAQNLVSLLSHLTGASTEEILGQVGGQGYSVLKARLVDAHEAFIMPIGERMREYLADQAGLDAILREGADKARIRAQETMAEVNLWCGFTF